VSAIVQWFILATKKQSSFRRIYALQPTATISGAFVSIKVKDRQHLWIVNKLFVRQFLFFAPKVPLVLNFIVFNIDICRVSFSDIQNEIIKSWRTAHRQSSSRNIYCTCLAKLQFTFASLKTSGSVSQPTKKQPRSRWGTAGTRSTIITKPPNTRNHYHHAG